VGPYGPISGPGRWDRGHTRRSNQTTFPLTKLLVLARRWTWIACIGQEMDVKKIYMLSCHYGNLAHMPTRPRPQSTRGRRERERLAAQGFLFLSQTGVSPSTSDESVRSTPAHHLIPGRSPPAGSAEGGSVGTELGGSQWSSKSRRACSDAVRSPGIAPGGAARRLASIEQGPENYASPKEAKGEKGLSIKALARYRSTSTPCSYSPAPCAISVTAVPCGS
jgi:hypothetical protein